MKTNPTGSGRLKPAATVEHGQAPAQASANPFARTLHGGLNCEIQDADGRLTALRTFTAAECRAVLALPGIQKGVREAAERRLRKMEREGPR